MPYFAFPNALPPSAVSRIAGNLPTKQIKIQDFSDRFVKPAKYVTTSFGVPGSRKIKNSTDCTFWLSFRNPIFSICLRETNSSTKRMPNLRTSRKTTTLLMVIVISQSSVPGTTPKIYPAASSKGPPGITANTTCKKLNIPKINIPQIPRSCIHTRSISGLDAKETSGRHNNIVRPAKTITTIAGIKKRYFFIFLYSLLWLSLF